MKHKKLIGILATSALLLSSVAFTACGGGQHTIERVDETQATCTEGGHAAYYKCTDEGCGKLFSDIEGKHEIKWDDVEKTDPLGHDMTHVAAKDATCTEDGAKDHYHCERCENDFADEAGATAETDAVLPALGHDMKVVEKVIPVTGKPGMKAHYRCEREGAEYFDSFGDKKLTDENKHELEYDMLTTAPSNWYDVQHDFSHSNDADPYVTIKAQNGLNVATSEYYSDLAYTARVRKADVNKQFVVLFFENKGIYSISVNGGKINCDADMAGWDYKTEQGYSYLNDQWDGYALSKGEQDCYEGDGLEVTLARKGKTVKVLVNGREVHTATLSSEYETQSVKGGMIVFDAVPEVKYYFRAEPQAQTPAAPKVTIAPVDAAQGAVTLNKETFEYGDELVIAIAPTDGYVFDKLTVNGRDVSALVSNKTYTTTATNSVNVSVVFKVKEFGSVNASVTGKKHGVTGNSIAENAAYELIGLNATYSGNLTGGKLNVASAVTGEYTLRIDGYFDVKITVEKDTAYTTEIPLEYDLLHANNVAPYGLTTDLSHQNDAESYIDVTHGGGHVNVFTVDRYTDLVFSATFKAGNSWRERKGIMLAFEDKKGVQIGFDSFGRENEVTLYFWGAMQEGDSAQLGANEKYIFDSTDRLLANTRLSTCNPITGALYEKYQSTGLTLSVVRSGNMIIVMLDGKIVGTVSVDEKYADDTVVAGVFTEWAEPHQIPFTISETLPAFTAPTFELTQGQNGTVTKTSGDTYSVWEKITLAIEPAFNYRLKQLTVNGVVVSGIKTEYSFYPVAGENTVVAEFEQIPYGSLNASVVSKKYGNPESALADGTKVTLIGEDNDEHELTVTNGKISADNMIAGKYTVKAEGLIDGTIVVPSEDVYETKIVLGVNSFMKGTGWYDDQQDLTHVNDDDAYVSIKADAADNKINVSTVKEYDEVAITLTFGKDMRGDNFVGPTILYGNQFFTITVQTTNKAFEVNGYDSFWGMSSIFPNQWDSVKMTDEEWAAFENNTLELTLVRRAGGVYVFVGNTLRMTKEVFSTQKVRAGIIGENTVRKIGDKIVEWHFKLEEDISEYEAVILANKQSSSIDATLTGKKHGVAGSSIADGTKVVLVGINNYEATVSEGKINVANVVAGTYAVKAEGYLDGTITVAEGAAYTTAIALEYNMFTTNGWYDAHQKFEHQNDAEAYVSVTGGERKDGVNFVTTNGYDQIAITVTIGKDFYAHERAGVLMKFGNKMVWFTVKQSNGAPVGFEWYGMGHWDTESLIPNVWGFDGAAFTEADTTSWNAGTMKLTLVRDGNLFHAFVNGTYRTTLRADSSYSTQKTQAGVRVEGSRTDGDKWFVSVEEDVASYLASTVTLNTPAHGSASASKTENVKLGDEITLTLTPDSGYRIKSVTVNGSALQAKNGVYKFNAVKTNAVVVEFEEIVYKNITFRADEKWNADGLVITFKRGTETKTVTLGNNAVIENMAMDNWTATTVIGNMTVSLGDIFIDSENFTLDMAKIFNDSALANKRVTSANLNTGTFVYNTEPKAGTLWLNTVNVAQGNAYIVTKISLPDASKTLLKSSGDKNEVFSIFLNVGGTVKNVSLWWKQDENAFKFYSLDNWSGTDNLSAELKNAFIDGDGFYVVWAYNAEAGKYEVYAGLTPQTVTKIGEWDTGLPKNGTLTAVGLGDGFAWDGQSYQLNVQVNYGTTLNEALGITEA